MPALEDFKIGSTVDGKYRVEERLGQGGMGSVYRVTHLYLNKQFALKAISSHVESDVAVQRFQQEAKTATLLSHPSLVQVHDFGVLEDSTPYLVMDFIDGITFAELLKQQGPISVDDVPILFSQVCFALLSAHECGIVHRDIKPGNIMLCTKIPKSAEGSVKIVDFGIAKLLFREAGEIQALTRTGEIFGSPLYMSPEQCTGDLVDHRSDIYSLGCVLFEMLTGTPPYVGPTALNTMMLHDTGKPPTLKEASLGKEFPPRLEGVVAKMLARSPGDRYANIGEAALSLTNACAGIGSQSSSNKSVKSTHSKPAITVSLSSQQLVLLVSTTAILSAILGALGMKFIDLNNQGLMNKSDPAISTNASPKGTIPPHGETTTTHEGSTESPFDSSGLDSADPKIILKETVKCLQNAAPITSTISGTDSSRKRTIVFPSCQIGTVEKYSRIMPAPVYFKAEGVRDFPADVAFTLDVGETAEALVATPSIITKVEPDLFKGLFIRLPKSVASDSEEKIKNDLATTLGALRHWKFLEALGLHNFALNNNAIEKFDLLDHLRCLELNNCRFDVHKIAGQKFWNTMEDLNLNHVGNVDAILVKLADSPNLKQLNIIGSEYSASALSSLKKCKNLNSLSVSANRVNDELVDAIKPIRSLRKVWLDGTNYKTEHVNKLLSYPWIKIIWLTGEDSPSEHKEFSDKRVRYLTH